MGIDFRLHSIAAWRILQTRQRDEVSTACGSGRVLISPRAARRVQAPWARNERGPRAGSPRGVSVIAPGVSPGTTATKNTFADPRRSAKS
jgi:hypothetical protein